MRRKTITLSDFRKMDTGTLKNLETLYYGNVYNTWLSEKDQNKNKVLAKRVEKVLKERA